MPYRTFLIVSSLFLTHLWADSPIDQLKKLGGDGDAIRFSVGTEWKGGDKGLALLARLPELKELWVNDTPTKVTDAGLSHLATLTKLQTLGISGTGLSDKGLIMILKGKTDLKTLSLARNQVTDAGLSSLQHLKSLERLFLSEKKVTGSCLQHLASMEKLQRLSLTGSGITESQLKHVAKLKGLKWFSVEQTNISNAAVMKLWDSLPQLRIVGKNGGIATAKGQKLGYGGDD